MTTNYDRAFNRKRQQVRADMSIEERMRQMAEDPMAIRDIAEQTLSRAPPAPPRESRRVKPALVQMNTITHNTNTGYGLSPVPKQQPSPVQIQKGCYSQSSRSVVGIYMPPPDLVPSPIWSI